MPERVLEFASYQAMIACVAAGYRICGGAQVCPGGSARDQEHTPARAPEAIFAQPHLPRVEWRSFAVAAWPDVAFGQHSQMMPQRRHVRTGALATVAATRVQPDRASRHPHPSSQHVKHWHTSPGPRPSGFRALRSSLAGGPLVGGQRRHSASVRSFKVSRLHRPGVPLSSRVGSRAAAPAPVLRDRIEPGPRRSDNAQPGSATT